MPGMFFVIDSRGRSSDNAGMLQTKKSRGALAVSWCVLLASCTPTASVGVGRPQPAAESSGGSAAAAAPANAPSPEAASVVQQSGAMSAVDAKQLQSQVMDFADDLTIRLAEALDGIEERTPSIESRVIAHRLKYTVAQGATVIAASTNSRIAMVDMLVMISLQRALLDKNIAPRHFGAAGDDLRAVFASAEREIRGLASSALSAEQLAEVDRLIARWLEENPDRKFAAYVRLSDFAAARQAMVQAQQGRASNVFGFLFIDPLAGLDPTTREIEQTRLFAERAFFYIQRMPVLVSWQTELLFIDTVSEPETREVLDATRRLTESVATITGEITALRADMPGMIADERAAAIDQAGEILDTQRQATIEQAIEGLRSEREALVEQLASEQERLGPMIQELRGALEASTELSESFRETTTAFSGLATQLRLGEPGDPDKKPFDINEYTAAIREAGQAATELTRLSESVSGATDPEALEDRLRLVDERIGEAEVSMQRLIDRAFRVGAILVVMLVVGLGGVVVLSFVLRRRVA